MKKMYFKDNSKLKILEVLSVIPSLCESIKGEELDGKYNALRKILVDIYASNKFKTSSELALEVAKKWQEQEDVKIDNEHLRDEIVKIGIYNFKMLEKVPQKMLELEKKAEKMLENSFVYDNIFSYLEENIKKIIISEVFKRFFNGLVLKRYCATKFKIKITNEKMDEIFEGESIKNERNFFMQQFQTWAIYNKIIDFVTFEEEEECLYIKFSLLRN